MRNRAKVLRLMQKCLRKNSEYDWAQPAVKIERLIRGLNSWPGTYSHWNGKVMKIWKAKVEGTSGGNSKPGTVLTVGKNDFTVQTGNGTLRIMEVQMRGKKEWRQELS